jgi:hypothetical protein
MASEAHGSASPSAGAATGRQVESSRFVQPVHA